MSKVELDQVMKVIDTLDAEELEQVNSAVQERLHSDAITSDREALHRALLASGLVREIKRRPAKREKQRPIFTHEGKPVSETIIEERR